MRLFLAGLVIGVWGAAHAQSQPTSDDVVIAKAHFSTGMIYYERGRFADAAREFEEAYRLSHRPELLYNMGKAYDGGSDKARALRAYRRFLTAVPETRDRPAVQARISALTQLVGRLRINSSVDGATVRVDGTEIGTTPLADEVEVNPGSHAVEVGHEGYATWRETVVGAPGALTAVEARPTSLVKIVRVEVARREAPQPVYKRWWLWAAVGAVVAAGAITGGVLGARSATEVSEPSAQLPGVR
jgi:tetratricopeptide (TPR) repeat protein